MVDVQSVLSGKAKPSVPRSDDMPVTRGMFVGMRTKLLQRIDQGREEARAENQKLNGNIEKVEAKIDAVRAELKVELHEPRATSHERKAGVARIEVLVEEQDARNRIVLDGSTAMRSCQNQVEQCVMQVEGTGRKFASVPPLPA